MPGFPGVCPKETNIYSNGNQQRPRLNPSWAPVAGDALQLSNEIKHLASFMPIYYVLLVIKIRFIETHFTRYCNGNLKTVKIFGSAFFPNRPTYPPLLQACCIIHHCCIMRFSMLLETNDIAYTAQYNLPFWNAWMKRFVAKPLTLSVRYTFLKSRFSFRSIQLWVGNILQFDGPPLPK